MDDSLTKRRRFLQSAGVSGTALLAGCSGILGTDDPDDGSEGDDVTTVDDESEDDGTGDDSTDDGTGDDGTGDDSTGDDGTGDDGSEDDIVPGEGDTREAGMIARPDQEALVALQQQVQAGEIEQAEARERQQEIIAEGVGTVVDILQAQTDLDVVEEFPEIGAIRVSGDPFEIVDSVTSARVSALVSISDLESQQQQTP